MRLVLATVCVLAGCHPGPASRPPIDIACTSDRVGRVSVEGGTAADVPQLAVLEGTLDDAARTERIAKVSEDVLRVRGYARAKVEVERKPGCGIELVVHVERGPKFRVARIKFETAPDDDFPKAARVAAIEDALGTVNAIGGAFVADRLARALAALAHRYQDAGWLDATIDAARPTYDDDTREVTLTIPVHAGPRYKLGSVVARGGRKATRAAVIEALGLRGGDWYDGRTVRQAIERMRRQVNQRVELHIEVAEGRAAIDLEAIVGAAK